MKRIHIFGRGIMGDLNANQEWDRGFAAKFMTSQTGDVRPDRTGVPFVYAAGPVGGAVWVKQQAMALAKLIVGYNFLGCAPDLTGHSHMCDIIPKALECVVQMPAPSSYIDPITQERVESGPRGFSPVVRNITLIAAATSRDFNVNGINDAAVRVIDADETQVLGSILMLSSHSDTVLATAGRLPGYGTLGLEGGTNIAPATRALLVGPAQQFSLPLDSLVDGTIWYPGADHNDYFTGDNYEATYNYATRFIDAVKMIDEDAMRTGGIP